MSSAPCQALILERGKGSGRRQRPGPGAPGAGDTSGAQQAGKEPGLQNAMVTRLSGAVIRTTHLTGITTDIGIEATRTLFWLFDRGRGAADETPGPRAPELRRLRLHLRIFGSFLFGATLGPALYLAVGSVSLLLPVFVLGSLALVDGALGFGKAYTGHGLEPDPASAELAAPPQRSAQ